MERGPRQRQHEERLRQRPTLEPYRLPEDAPQRPDSDAPRLLAPLNWKIGLATFAGLAAAAALSFTTHFRSGRDEELSTALKAERLTAFKAQQPFSLARVPDPARQEAISQMGLEPGAQTALEQDLEQGRAFLGTLSLWDDQYQDGDAVALSGGGFSKPISLTKQPQDITVPIASSGTTFLIRGTRDGGGGITVAAKSNGQVLPLPIMESGETFDLTLEGVAP